MATRIFSRLFPKTLTLTTITSRSLSTTPPSSALSFLRRLRPLSSAVNTSRRVLFLPPSFRSLSTRATTSSLNDPNPNCSDPEDDGQDFLHWLVTMEKPEGDPTRDEIIDSYIKALSKVTGSEDEARKMIYSVSTKYYYAFGALASEELAYRIREELPRVRWVLPDSYANPEEKTYGGEPFINGQAVPYDPKYHKDWVENREMVRKHREECVRNRNERKRNENDRILIENERKGNENDRIANENERQRIENERQRIENDTIWTENERQRIENDLIRNESERQHIENERQQIENHWIRNEKERQHIVNEKRRLDNSFW